MNPIAFRALACFVGCGLLVLGAAALVPQPATPRPCTCSPPAVRVPALPRDLQHRLDVLEARATQLAGEAARARRIRAAEDAVLLARSQRERAAAVRKLVATRRSP